jgi:hypothetical protein
MNTKLGMFDNLVHNTNLANFGHDRIQGLSGQWDEIYHFGFSPFILSLSPSNPTSTCKYYPIFVVDTSNRPVCPCVHVHRWYRHNAGRQNASGQNASGIMTLKGIVTYNYQKAHVKTCNNSLVTPESSHLRHFRQHLKKGYNRRAKIR